MFQLLVSTTYFPLFATDGSLIDDCPQPAHVELIRLLRNVVNVPGACAWSPVSGPPLDCTSARLVCAPVDGATCLASPAMAASRAASWAAVGWYGVVLTAGRTLVGVGAWPTWVGLATAPAG